MRSVFLNLFLCIVLLYFVANALSGEQGLAQWAKLQKKEDALQQKLASLKVEKLEIQSRIERLSPETLDLDYIEEIARKRLAYVKKDEVIIVVDQ